MTATPRKELSQLEITPEVEGLVAGWIHKLRQVGYFIPYQMALPVAFWWRDRGGPLILEGPPGGGKTRLAEAIIDCCGLREHFYRVQCYRSISRSQTLYDWDRKLQDIALDAYVQMHDGRAPENPSEVIYDVKNMVPGQLARVLQDTNPDATLLIDEIDKVPSGEGFEAVLLEYLGEHKITVAEANRQITPASGFPPHTVITSNAGIDNSSLVETLSYPLLRRGLYRIWVPEPDPATRYKILRTNAIKVNSTLIVDVVHFIEYISDWKLDKAVALSETINWIRFLEFLAVDELTPDVVAATLGAIAKLTTDTERLADGIRAILVHIKNKRQQINVEQCEADIANFLEAQ
jgi:MoxR-like ATPase